ncbi:hypothetical protein BC828DRAFT_440026 [Blastocladiella britannica]|nr:hypothetical protein BC828DRAFT_440026 [Blastocladiella britannica]
MSIFSCAEYNKTVLICLLLHPAESDIVTDSTSVRGAFKNGPVELAQYTLLRISRHATEVAYDGSRALLAIVDYCSANAFRKESPDLLAKEEAEKAARALKAKKAKDAKDAKEAQADEADEQVAVEDPQAVIATIAVLAAMDAKELVRELLAKWMKELAAKRLETTKRQKVVNEKAAAVACLTCKLATAAAGDRAQVHVELEKAKADKKDTASLLDNSQNRIFELEQLLVVAKQVVAKQAAAVQAAAEKAERDNDSRDHPEGNRRYPCHNLAHPNPLLPSNWAYTPPSLDLPFLLAYLDSSCTGSRSRCFSFFPFSLDFRIGCDRREQRCEMRNVKRMRCCKPVPRNG